jgi:uncharacterized membrane protein YcaP (DUF421 family)
MWHLDLPWWQFVARAAIVYFFLMALLRLSGKRQGGQLSAFDLVLLLILSNAVQNSMNGGDNSILGGLILATTLVLLNFGIGWLTFYSRTAERLIDSRPEVLVRDGHVNRAALLRTQVTMHELNAGLRAAGCCGPTKVRFAVLETNGHITVITEEGDSPTTDPQTPAH